MLKKNVVSKVESELRETTSRQMGMLEAILYVGVAILLAATAVNSLVHATMILWRSLGGSDTLANGLLVLDQILLVLMLIEILHTVRISLASRELMLIGPFLVVALIASIRRVLLITLQAAKLAEGTSTGLEPAVAFRNGMIELGLLGFLILVFAISIYLVRQSNQEERSPL